MSWYLEVIKKYAVFSGRARRKEYWMFTLVNLLIIIALGIVSSTTSLDNGGLGAASILLLVYYCGVLLPSLAVCIRRLHDTGHSGWWILIGIIPLIGSIILLVFFVTAGQTGPNSYGPDPKEMTI